MDDAVNIDRPRVSVWNAMADQFLDTEARPDIPQVALRCLDAGYDVEQARDIWRHEVTPAVAFNLYDPVGEWAGWNEEWLVKRILDRRGHWDSRPGAAGVLFYWLRAWMIDGVWRAIAACMRFLAAAPPERRQQLVDDLQLLADHRLDNVPRAIPEERLAELAALERDVFEPVFRPALLPTERWSRDRRVGLCTRP